MAQNEKLKLSKALSKFLENFPEQGMGYQIVNIELKDGTILYNRIVLNSTFLKLNANESLDLETIKFIKLSENKDFH